MTFPIIQAVIDGVKMQDMAAKRNISPNEMTALLRNEMQYVANHPLNRSSVMAETLQTQNAFAIRRNPRAWSLAIANATKQTVERGSLPMASTLAFNTIDDAFDVALKYNLSIKDAMVIVYNTTLKQLTSAESK